MTAATAEQNRSIILQAYEDLFVKGNVDGLAALLHEDYTEHKEGWPSGREQAVEFFRNSPISDAEVELLHVIADDEHVAVHARSTVANVSRPVVDIWRIEDGRIAEHWDVVHGG